MIPEKISKQIENAFIGELEEKYHLVYTHYDDNLNNSPYVFQECMEVQNSIPVFEKLNDWIFNCQYHVSNDIIGKIKNDILNDNNHSDIHQYIDRWLNDAENIDNLRYDITERDDSDPVTELVNKTSLRARVTQFTNFDCLPSRRDMGNTYPYTGYFKDIIDTLCLNPAIVKQTFNKIGINTVGRFPNLSYRNGKEAVDYAEFAQEVSNQYCYCHLVFMGMLPLKSMYANDFNIHQKIIIPKGNCCGFYSWWNGEGSLLEMTLKRDLILPVKIPRKTEYDRFQLDIDETNCGNGYCIDEVYGMVTSAWGKKFQLIYN